LYESIIIVLQKLILNNTNKIDQLSVPSEEIESLREVSHIVVTWEECIDAISIRRSLQHLASVWASDVLVEAKGRIIDIREDTRVKCVRESERIGNPAYKSRKFLSIDGDLAEIFKPPDDGIFTRCKFERLNSFVKKEMNTICCLVMSFYDCCVQVVQLDQAYLSLLRDLYQDINVPVDVVVQCCGGSGHVNCSRVLKILVVASRLDTGVSEAIDANRTLWEQNLMRLSGVSDKWIIQMAASILHVFLNVEDFIGHYAVHRRASDAPQMVAIGQALFYDIVQLAQDLKVNFQPLQDMILRIVSALGQAFISSDRLQIPVISGLLLRNQQCCSFLMPFFEPQRATEADYCAIYAEVIYALPNAVVPVEIIEWMISKFDVLSVLPSFADNSVISLMILTIEAGTLTTQVANIGHLVKMFSKTFVEIVTFSFPKYFTVGVFNALKVSNPFTGILMDAVNVELDVRQYLVQYPDVSLSILRIFRITCVRSSLTAIF
uniref:Mediator complex subunit 23 n=1 Tax=Soboliphyme baturini TaxID=241478 RepID=A0A183IZX3_9BILA